MLSTLLPAGWQPMYLFGLDGQGLERTLTNAVEFGELLNDVFDLSPPGSAAAVFARLPAG